LAGVDAEHGAADAGVFVAAGSAVGTAAVAEFEFPGLEVLLELRPFLGGGFAVFVGRSGGASVVEKCSVGADQVFLEDGEVAWVVSRRSAAMIALRISLLTVAGCSLPRCGFAEGGTDVVLDGASVGVQRGRGASAVRDLFLELRFPQVDELSELVHRGGADGCPGSDR
jgi:hypothetical protein